MRLLLTALLLCCLSLITAAQKREADSGKLIILSAGKQVGTETFTVKDDSTAEGSDVLNVNGATVNFKSSTEYKDAHPASFTLEQEPNIKLQVAVTGADVKITGIKEMNGQTDPGAVFLENNIWYQYYFLARRYDSQKGGVQQFKAFVPSVLQTIPLSLELKGQVGPVPGFSAKLSYYRAIAANSVTLDIVADPQGRLVYVGVPAQKAVAVREEYAASLPQLRAALAPAKAPAPIDYSAPPDAPFTAEEVVIPLKAYKLAGTLLMPKICRRPCPAVVMITGSGQQTRDEPVPFPGLEKYMPFRQIAEALATHNIAVLRVDDRGVGLSTGIETVALATSADFADDTRAEVAYLRTRRDIDPKRIALVGHSEGGMIAPMVAATDPDIAAIILMAGDGKRGDWISMYQIERALEENRTLTKEQKDEARAKEQAMIRAVQEGGDLSSYPPEVRLPWVKFFYTYDPLPAIRKVRQPILILQGGLDRQITPDQATLLEQAARAGGNKDVTVRIFPNLNHLFLPAQTGAVSEYPSLKTTSLGDDLLTFMSEWLQCRLHA